jgi:hypothetical protein
MNNPVEIGLVLSHSFPSGTGSYNYQGSFKIVVQNLAHQKQVAIWAQLGTVWKEIAASHVQSLPENREMWSAPASNGEAQFVAKYTVNGTTYWDNNGGTNYNFPQAFDSFALLAGHNYKVVLGSASLAGATLHVRLGVQNLAYHKVVGIVFTTDNWATVKTAYAQYNSTMTSGMERWDVTAPVGSTAEVKLAVFYQVSGGEHWDNNFWRNYKVMASGTTSWGDPP